MPDSSTTTALRMLDMLKAHHPNAVDATSDAELLGYVMTDAVLLAEGLRLDWNVLVKKAEADARSEMRTFGFVDTTAFQPAPPAVATTDNTALVDRINDMRSAIVLASDYLSQHIERHHDTEEPSTEHQSLSGIQAHLMGTLIGDDDAALASRPAEATSRERVEAYRKRYKHLAGIYQLPPKASDAGTA